MRRSKTDRDVPHIVITDQGRCQRLKKTTSRSRPLSTSVSIGGGGEGVGELGGAILVEGQNVAAPARLRSIGRLERKERAKKFLSERARLIDR